MRKPLISLLPLASAVPVLAQTTPPANRDANTPAVNSPNSPPNPVRPLLEQIASLKAKPSPG